ncbi:hypothetical protein GGI04_000705 [Coemansia thaxteri]|uniref:Tyrosinase copper-binding domain-containing protein n=1 Tax=Coemansia thaxteri TaxID=2663907 RepID=A0A9W8BBF2_9FUNG|nr:hypothetical protein H4R26_004051 [Coemansia thaxteri]KAJ2009145.1 hypothetical protein GGI04_000705 [Coemansia thaxteri]KAJ2473728.1 hypothetical protein GGI02_000654 [Coemansia sp. RSA 2322]KAJ2486772.1 hypothetical protein EV174_000932 [Coemansia sp. RSA 2320]
MKLTSAFIALAALVGAGVNAQSQCGSLAVRKEIRSLSPTEWNRFASVTRAMQNSGWFGWFAFIHTQNFGTIHGNEMFFPFHRRFIRDFESVGQMFDRNFALPYWDELRDYASPSSSAVLSSNFLGSNGRDNSCVRDGVQNGWTLTYPNNHCLRRQYVNGDRINPWYSPEFIQSVLSRSTRMSQLRPGIEFSLHGTVHLALGGDMVQDYSPNDIVFWVHHANVDRVWSVWQLQNPNQNFWSMDGYDASGKAMTYTSPVPHYGDQVISTMRLGSNGMCFYYDNGNSVSSRQLSTPVAKRDGVQKCIPRPPTDSHPSTPVAMPPLVEGVFNNVNSLPVAADTYVQNTIAQKLPPVVLDKWFPTYTAGTPLGSNGTAPEVPPAPNVSIAIPVPPAYTAFPQPPAYTAVPPAPAYSTAPPSPAYSVAPSGGYYTTDTNDAVYSSANEEDVYSSIAQQSDAYSAIPAPTHVPSDAYNSQEEQQLYSEDYHVFELDDESGSLGLDGEGPKYPMPNPFPMPPSWVKMHGYPPDEVHKQYTIARDFVSDMNAAGYQSPFAKGASA